jgi:hypothetical protein
MRLRGDFSLGCSVGCCLVEMLKLEGRDILICFLAKSFDESNLNFQL